MHRANVRLVPLMALLAVVACDEEILSLAEGEPSTLAVRIYVDADGNGQYDAGTDVAVADVTVTATSDAGDQTATSSADGVASFAGLLPGSYTLAAAGATPSGSVLASSSSPSVVAPFQGAALSAEFRYSFFPGGIAGTVYRDEDANGAFDVGTDVGAPGVELTVVDASNDTLSAASTDNDGAFTFEGLRPGDYTIEITPFAGLTFVDGTSQAVTVGADASTSFDIEFTGSLAATPIAEARGMAGEVVTIEGVVSWQKWDARGYYIQDETGGIAVFDAAGPTLARGDSLRLRGTIGAFDGETQISSIVSFSNVAAVGEPTPRSVTASQINANQFQGELARIAGEVDSVLNPSFGNQLVYLTDPLGQTFTVYGDSRNGSAVSDWPAAGTAVTVVGVLATDDDDDFMFRLETRDPDDLTVFDPPTAIGTARGLTFGDTVTVEGVVTWQYGWDSRVYYVQDGSGGIGTFDFARPDLQRGDLVRIRGVVGAFDGELQLSPIVQLGYVGQEPVPTPQTVTAADVNGGAVLGRLVTLTGVVDSVLDPGFGSQLVYITDGANATVTAFGDNRMGLTLGDWTQGATVTVVGVVAADDDFTFQNRIELRDPNDLITGPVPVDIASARALPAGDTVTVEGVVTWQYGWDTRVYYVQDATGGIGTFDSNRPDLKRGDRIRIRGRRGAFDGEEQLSPILSLDVVGQEAVPTPIVVTAADVNGGAVMGQLVTLTGMVDSVLDPGFGSQLVYMTDANNQTVTAFGDNRMGLTLGDWTAGVMVTVVGIVAGDDDFTFQNRIELRDPNDKQ